ncbi:hypothetical protein HNY73_021730 [Argiope bruennichi]|uniref:Uncharacterized protein n=1 Tax=Argiope bruennichi TaxID=94029 RepID=A0A8T0DZE6_ARGBR|nr:hypothetical protein HNY73_021730 [Argiope bruennichi]
MTPPAANDSLVNAFSTPRSSNEGRGTKTHRNQKIIKAATEEGKNITNRYIQKFKVKNPRRTFLENDSQQLLPLSTLPKSIRGQDPFPQDDFSIPSPLSPFPRHIADACNNLKPESLQQQAPPPPLTALFCRSLSRCHVINVAKRGRRRSKPWCVNPLCALAKDWRGAQRAINKINFPVLLSFSLSRSYFRYSSRERSNSIEEPCRVEWSCPGPGMHEFNKAQKDSRTS